MRFTFGQPFPVKTQKIGLLGFSMPSKGYKSYASDDESKTSNEDKTTWISTKKLLFYVNLTTLALRSDLATSDLNYFSQRSITFNKTEGYKRFVGNVVEEQDKVLFARG